MAEETSQNNVQKSEIALREEATVAFWKDQKIFEKTLEKSSPKGNFVFYDGPPFATGMPHYGHLLPGTVKDVIPRYKTMRGYHVERRWGWDTHGLPIENLIEKELGLQTKKDIEAYGIDKFNRAARDSVFRYDAEWKKIIPRTGRWVDMENAYNTMAPAYTESVWWAFKEMHHKNLLSEGFKSMHLCPRCETTLSNFEVNQGYVDITDISVYAKFELIDELGTFVIAWTTTPWTLPGNVALAINPNETYVKVMSEGSRYIVVKKLLAVVFEGKEFSEEKDVAAADLIGKAYKPLFNYYANDPKVENRERGWKIYAGDFVTTEEGTGVVHIAPAFGDEDYELSRKEKLPFVQHVQKDGSFKPEVTDFAGMKVKPKDDHQSTDIEIIKHLAHAGLLFAKKKIIHSYPHCWRCDTPLLNYASSSWFIDVPALRDKLVALNEKITWVPETIGKNRFGNWLKEAKEWAISRSRFWGAPLPVWKSVDGSEVVIMGSVADIKRHTVGTNNYFVMRHGEAESNVKGIVSSDNSTLAPLTEQGEEQARAAAKELKGKKIDFIITSPLERTQETARIVAEELGLAAEAVITDDRIKEIYAGVFNGKPINDYRAQFASVLEKMTKPSEGGENVEDMRLRVGDFMYDIDKKYEGKNILIVTHEYGVWTMVANAKGLNREEAAALKEMYDDFVPTGHVMPLDFAPLPHNEKYELDLHRPYIDSIVFVHNGKEMCRIEDVFDVWIDSGSVPFASFHYPFSRVAEPRAGFLQARRKYPADFIAEGLDQTRGWFYTMLVLNAALFDVAPYKNVIVNGLVLAEDGKKMSKRLKNYPEVSYILDKYGADAMRYFLMSSPAVRAEDVNFSEKGVDEIYKKLILRLNNVVSFYEMYKVEETKKAEPNVLDDWILARLDGMKKEMTESLDRYELDKASRPLLDFIDDLSTWYLRRSRDRFKNEQPETLRFVLVELSKLLAPFTPFIAEDVYRRAGGEKASVHLEDWPMPKKDADMTALNDMKSVRDVVTLALEARAKANIKVRQPLATLFVKDSTLGGKQELIDVIADEVNVKGVSFDATLDAPVKLDTSITTELKQEGDLRELIRFVQSMRKDMKLNPADRVTLTVSENAKPLVSLFENELKKIAGVETISFGEDGGELELSDMKVKAAIKK